MTVQYLIDSENVGDFWIPLLDLPADETELIVFYTRNSPHMSYESLIKLKESDRTVTFIKCYEGTNALDFQLVSELGYRIGNDEDGRFVIVTNDTGFDAAVKYWRRRKKSVKRVTGRECRNLVRRLREDLSIGLHDGQHSHSLDVSDHLDMDTDHSKEQDVHDEAIHAESAEANEVRSSGPNLRDAERAAQPDAEESFSEAESEYMMDAEIDEADGDDADEFAYDREAEESEADAFDDDADEDEEELDDIRAQESGRDSIEDTEEEIRVSDEAVSEDESAIEDSVTDDGTVPVQDDESWYQPECDLPAEADDGAVVARVGEGVVHREQHLPAQEVQHQFVDMRGPCQMNPRIFAAYQEDEEQDVGHKRLEEPESAAGVEDVKPVQIDLPLKPDQIRVNVHGLEEPGFGVDIPDVKCRTFKKTRVDLHNVVNVRQFLGLVQIGEVHV